MRPTPGSEGDGPPLRGRRGPASPPDTSAGLGPLPGAPLRYSAGELRVDRLVHGIGVTAGLVAAIALIWVLIRGRDIDHLIAGAVYATGLLAMLICSAAYHMTHAPRRRELLRRFDHAAIFLMIAGTYTPFLASTPDPAWSLSFLGAVWFVAALGITIKLAFPRSFERTSVLAYLLLGWLGLFALGPLFSSADTSTVALLVIGGVIYTSGVVFHLWEELRFHNAVWHAMVVAAAGCHYWAVFQDIALAPRL